MAKNDIIIRVSASDEGVRTGVNRSQAHLSRLEKTTAASAARIEGALDRAARNVEQSFRRSFQAAGGLASAYLGSEAVRGIVRYSDQWKSLEARLKTVTGGASEAANALGFITKTAKEQQVEILSLADGYLRLYPNVKAGVLSVAELDRILKLTNDNIKAFGLGTSEVNGLFYGLSQVLGSGTVTMEDLRQVTERMPGSMNRLADAMGVDGVGALKKLIATGAVTAEQLKGPLVEALAANEGAAVKMAKTVSSAMTELDNAFLQYVGRNDLVQSSTSSLAATISGIADNFETVANVVTVAGVAIGGRLATAMVASQAAFISNAIAASNLSFRISILNQHYGKLAAASYVATTATGKLNTAINAIFGGKIGLAITALTAAYMVFGDETQDATDYQIAFNEDIQKAKGFFDDLKNATKEETEQLKKRQDEQIRSAELSYQQAEASLTNARAIREETKAKLDDVFALDEKGTFKKTALDGLEKDFPELHPNIEAEEDKVRALKKQLADLQQIRKNGNTTTESSVTIQNKHNTALSKAAAAASTAAKNQNDLNKALADMQGKLDYDRATDGMDEYEKSIYDARQEVKKLEVQYGTFNAAQRKTAEAYIRQVELFQQGKKSAAAETERLNEAAEAAEKYAEAMRKPFENALEGIQSTISDTFAGVFDGSVDSASDAANAIKKIFVRMAAEVATLQLIQTSGLDQVLNATGKGGIKGAVGAKSGSVVGDVFRQGTSLLGSTSIGAAIDGFGVSALPSIFGTGAPIAGTVGPQAAGILGGAGIGLSSIALPVAGLAIGALLSGAFGKSKPHPASNFAASLTDKGADSKLFSKHTDTSTAKALADSVALISQSLVNQGINVAGKTVQGGVDNNRGFLTIGTHDFKSAINDPAKTIRFDPNGGEGATNEAFAELTKRLALSAKEAEKYAANLALITTKGRDADAVLTDISFVLGFEKLGDTPKVLTETEQAIVELRKTFKNAADMADRLGLSVEKVRSVEAQRVRDMLDQSAAGIAARLIEATQPNQANLTQENLRYAAELRDLQALGATNKELHMAEVLHQLNVHKIMEGNVDMQQEALDKEKTRMEVAKELAERFARVQTSMKSLIGDLTTGKFSNLDPQSNLDQMRAQVQMLGKQAQLGDAAAAEELSQLIPAFLELSGQVNGYNEVYERDRVASLNIAQNTLSVAERQISLQQQIVSEAQMQTAVLTAGFAGLESALTRFGGGLTVSDVTGAAAGGDRFGARPALNQALAVATGFTGRFSPDQSKDQFAAFRAANPQLEPIIAAVMKSQGFATGGLIGGASSGSDTLLARVTKGEFVMSPSAVRAISAPALRVMNETGKIPTDSGVQEGLNRLESRIIDLTKTVAMGGNLTVVELQTMNEELSAIKRHANLSAARS